MSDFGRALNRIVQGRDESPEEMEVVAEKTARRVSQDAIVFGDALQPVGTRDFTTLRRILVIRGFVMFSFDPLTREWERCSDARRDRAYFETVLLKGFVYAIGSFNVCSTGTVERFVLSENQWEICASLPVKIRSLAAAAVPTSRGNVLYVCGGIDTASMTSSSNVYTFNPVGGDKDKVGRWDKVLSHMLTPRYRHSVVVFEGYLWALGGIVSGEGGEEHTNTTERMDCATGLWSLGPLMSARRAIDVAPIVIGDVLYVLGGDVSKSGEDVCQSTDANGVEKVSSRRLLGTIERFDSKTNCFTKIASFPHQRTGFSAALIPGDNKIYCFGGRQGDQDLTSWDAFDTSSGQWDSVSQPNQARSMPFMDCLYGRAIAI